MLIIPIGREDDELRRQPSVTYALIALNTLFFLMFCLQSTDLDRSRLIRSWRSTISYLRDRPYLRPPQPAANLLPSDLRHRVARPDPSVEDWQRAREQDTLDEMAAELRLLHEDVADVRMAYVPAVGDPFTIFTSMFLHAGLLHLVGNMLFLFAVAPFVEDAYGKAVFLLLYLTGGVAATLAFGARYPNLLTPLVGASGAVSAVMGVYLVLFARSRLRFLFIPIVFLPMWHFRFSAPALVVLPIWFLEQIVSIPMEGGSGVAVTAHVAGFAYGLLFALAWKAMRFERRLTRATTEEEQPSSTAALRLALEQAVFHENAAGIDTAATRLAAALESAKDGRSMRDLIVELDPTSSVHHLPQFTSRAAAFAERTGDRPLAIALYEHLCRTEAASGSVVPALVKLAMLRKSKGDIAGAREALARASAHPACSPEWRRRIDSTMAMISAG